MSEGSRAADGGVTGTHGVFSQQVVLGVSLAAVDGPQSAEKRPPSRKDLRRTHLNQLTDRCHHLRAEKRPTERSA